MAWRDKLQKGSFRGAAFLWQKSDGEGGRRTVWHEYPLRDDAWPEDLGKLPREFTLDVIVIGPNYLADRDRLIAAVEEPGPGTLVHPTHGALRVSLNGRVRWSETTDEGGMCRFTLPFRLAGPNAGPVAVVDTAGAVVSKAAIVLEGLKDNFGKSYTTARKPAFVADAAVSLTGQLLGRLQDLRNLVAPPLLPAQLTDLVATLDAVRTTIATLVHTPLDLAAEVQGLIAKLGLLTINPFAAIDAYSGLFDFGSDADPVTGSSDSRISQSNNQAALFNLVRTTALTAACSAASSAEFTSYQEALRLRRTLADRLTTLMETAGDDLYGVLRELRLAVIVDISTRGADLARIVPYTPAATLPALLISYRLYGTASRETELVERNRLQHPGFVPGGAPLEVLT